VEPRIPEGCNLHRTEHCCEDPQFVSISDADGAIWTVRYSVGGGRGTKTGPAIYPLGRALELNYQTRSSWSSGEAAGFTIRDAVGVMTAVEYSNGLDIFGERPFPGLRLALGASTFARPTHCATRRQRALEFHADQRTVLTPGSRAPITVGGRRYLAHSVEAWDLVNVGCSDMFGEGRQWALLP